MPRYALKCLSFIFTCFLYLRVFWFKQFICLWIFWKINHHFKWIHSKNPIHFSIQFNKLWALLGTINPHKPFYWIPSTINNLLGELRFCLRFTYTAVLGKKDEICFLFFIYILSHLNVYLGFQLIICLVRCYFTLILCWKWILNVHNLKTKSCKMKHE